MTIPCSIVLALAMTAASSFVGFGVSASAQERPGVDPQRETDNEPGKTTKQRERQDTAEQQQHRRKQDKQEQVQQKHEQREERQEEARKQEERQQHRQEQAQQQELQRKERQEKAEQQQERRQQHSQEQAQQQKLEKQKQQSAERKDLEQQRRQHEVRHEQERRQERLSRQEQQRRIEQQRQRLVQYRVHLEAQRRLVEQQSARLQQEKRMAQYRFQQQYLERLRQQQVRLQNERHHDYDNDPYFYTPPSQRYLRGGRYYETNQYGAKLLRRAVSYGYREGVHAGQADREDRWASNYRNSYAYQDANYGYDGYYVERDEYNHYFREGFQRGYEDGYDSRRQYGSESDGRNSILGTVLAAILNLQPLR